MKQPSMRCELRPDLRERLQRMQQEEAQGFANRLALTVICGIALLAKDADSETAVSICAIEIGRFWRAFLQKFPVAPDVVDTAAAIDFVEISAGKIWGLYASESNSILREKLLSLVEPITRKLH